MFSKTKVAIFDFDGTLTKHNSNSTWEEIWVMLGYKVSDCKRFYNKFKNGIITHKEWCTITANKFRKKNLLLSQVKDIAKRNIHLIDGTKETLEILKQNKVQLHILSGAIDTIIEETLQINKINPKHFFNKIQANNFIYSGDEHFFNIEGTIYDFEGKRDYINSFISSSKIDKEKIFYIGNAYNDNWVHETGVKTILVNPVLNEFQEIELQNWDYKITPMNNLKQILEYMN